MPTPQNDTKGQNKAQRAAEIEKCYSYYLKGLTAAEIGTLTGLSVRSVQRLTATHKFAERAEPVHLRDKAAELRRQGHSLSAIARAIGKGKTTVYYYLKAAPPAEDAAPE